MTETESKPAKWTVVIDDLTGGRHPVPIKGEWPDKQGVWNFVLQYEQTRSGELTVMENGARRATFNWFRVGPEPHPGHPGKTRDVFALRKWEGFEKGWTDTGWEATGAGKDRVTRKV